MLYEQGDGDGGHSGAEECAGGGEGEGGRCAVEAEREDGEGGEGKGVCHQEEVLCGDIELRLGGWWQGRLESQGKR